MCIPRLILVAVDRCLSLFCHVLTPFVLVLHVGVKNMGYSHFAYSHFAYSHFAYSQMLSMSRFAYTQDFCALPSFKGFLIKPVLIGTTLMRQILLLMVNYNCIFCLYFMSKYSEKRCLQIDKIGTIINCYCIVLY